MSRLQGSVSDQELVRFHAGDLIERGFDNDEIVKTLEVSLSTVKRWHKKVESSGLTALVRKPGSGAEDKLTPKQFELKTILQQGAIASGYKPSGVFDALVASVKRKTATADVLLGEDGVPMAALDFERENFGENAIIAA